MVHGVYPNDHEPPAVNACLARVRNHVTSPSRSSLVAPPPPLKRQPGVRGSGLKARSYPGTDRDRRLATWKPGRPAHGAGRGGRSVTSGSGSQPFLPPPLRVALAARLYGRLPAVLPLSRGGFRGAVACFRFPTAVDARAVEAGCRGKLSSADVLGGRAARELQARGGGRLRVPMATRAFSGKREDAGRKSREKGEKGGWKLTVYHLGSPTTHLFKEQKKSLEG